MNYQIVGVLIISYFATKLVISPSSKKKGREMKVSRSFSIFNFQFLHILLPTLNLQSLDSYCAECLDESRDKSCVGDERDVVIDGAATDAVAVGMFALGVVLRNDDDDVK